MKFAEKLLQTTIDEYFFFCRNLEYALNEIKDGVNCQICQPRKYNKFS